LKTNQEEQNHWLTNSIEHPTLSTGKYMLLWMLPANKDGVLYLPKWWQPLIKRWEK